MTKNEIYDLISRTQARLARYAKPGEHGVKEIVNPMGLKQLNAYIPVCPEGCRGEFVAEYTDYSCIVVKRCKHGYFYYNA